MTRILDEAGREIGLVDSRWVLVDTDTPHPAPPARGVCRTAL